MSLWEPGRPLDALIICTRNRGVQLERCLDALRAVDFGERWGLILVDNGSTDGTPELLSRFQQTVEFPVALVHAQRPGLGRARNAGLARTEGALVVFTDDDCYPDPGFLASWGKLFDEHPEVAFGGGRIELYDPADLPITIQTLAEPRVVSPGAFIEAGFINGANMGFRRGALAAIGDFDPETGAGTPFPFEDVDAQLRLSAAGYAGYYSPQPLVLHHHGRRGEADRAFLMAQYARGRGACYAKVLLDAGLRRSFAREVLRRLYRARGKGFYGQLVGVWSYLLHRLGRAMTFGGSPSSEGAAGVR